MTHLPALYKNNHNGTFTDIGFEAGVAFSADGKPQAGMGVSAIDYDGDGRSISSRQTSPVTHEPLSQPEDVI
jgi:hypothetical protein